MLKYGNVQKTITNGRIDISEINKVVKLISVEFPGEKVRREPHQTLDTIKKSLDFLSRNNINNPLTAVSLAAGSSRIPEYQECTDEDFKSMTITFNGHNRLSPRPPDYYKYDQPYMVNYPDSFDHTYVYSFALRPMDNKPSGTVDFGRIKNSQIIFTGAKEGTKVNVKYMLEKVN